MLVDVVELRRNGTRLPDAELKIWVTGGGAPFQKQISKQLSIYEVQSVLANYVLV